MSLSFAPRPGSNQRPGAKAGGSEFSETLAWSQIQANWKQLGGAFRQLGVSFEWHEFETATAFDWSKSFHPESLELCLNLEGEGVVGTARPLRLGPQSAGFYWTGSRTPPPAARPERQSHRFVTVEYSRAFLDRHLGQSSEGIHPVLASALRGQAAPQVSEAARLTSHHQELIASLRRPPVYRWAQYTWYAGKALEVASLFFFQPPPEEDLFCHRQQVQAQERVERVKALLRAHLVEPPSLEEIARKVGCSPYYLSRTFSKETGTTISQFIRQLRMEKAAELLKSGKYNVTEAALEVGYSSLSHFSQSFHETFGCCPGLYPLRPMGGEKAKAGA